MTILQLTPSQARRYLLHYQGLYPAAGWQGKSGILAFIRKVGCVQFDPLNIAGHNHELVLHARVEDFSPADLKSLLYEDRRLLDGWDKMMSIYCVEDWPYFQRYRDHYHHRLNAPHRPAADVLPQMRAALQERGPLSSKDLDINHTVDWFWAPTRAARAALESMYYWGELVIHHKIHTRKVYDFADRCLPAGLLNTPDPNPRDEDYFAWHVARRVRSVGLLWDRAGDAWLGILGLKARQREAALQRLAAEKHLVEVAVEGIPYTFYAPAESLPLLESISPQDGLPGRVSFLAPLDNLLWDRRMIQTLFHFNYRWEVYKPITERQYGYYVLPVLFGEHLVARIEPRLEKKTRELVILNWWWEDHRPPSALFQPQLQAALQRLASFLGAKSLRMSAQASQSLEMETSPEHAE